MTQLQPLSELEEFYSVPDPWSYRHHPDDARRRNELMSLLPSRPFARTLDIGCGDGFITFDLPGDQVVGVDVSKQALHWAEQERQRRPDGARFSFHRASIFNLDQAATGQFDLIVITGVLYRQYIGAGFPVIAHGVDQLLAPGGCLVSCHIDEWAPPRFPYTLLDISLYPYREHTHRIEVQLK